MTGTPSENLAPRGPEGNYEDVIDKKSVIGFEMLRRRAGARQCLPGARATPRLSYVAQTSGRNTFGLRAAEAS